MTEAIDLDDTPVAPPRDNGELVFTESWQPRLFATTMALRERGLLEWERFRQGLISQIAEHEADLTDNDQYDYWGCWQRALEALLSELDLVATDELAATSRQLAERPPDH